MRKYFLGFFPDQKSNQEIRGVVRDIGRVFDGQEIKVRWTNPDNLHVSLFFLGSDLNFIQKYLYFNKLKNLIIPKFAIRLNDCDLGSARSYKEMVYLTVREGGEELRNLVYSLRNIVGSNDLSNYLPHITLGRVSKDLTNEEYRNLVTDLKNINKSLNIDKIVFTSEKLCLVESDGDNYKVLKNFPTA